MRAADGEDDDWHSERGKHSEIQWQYPASTLQITAIGALDHANLELTRQAEDRGRGKQRRNERVAVEHRGCGLEFCGQFERTALQLQPRIEADGYKSHYFQQRFESDGEHQSFMMLRGVDPASAE